MQAIDEQYIADMRFEASVRREQARDKEGPDRDWLLEQAAYFDACATEAELKADH